MKLVIAEKPMLARDIARAVCGKTVSETARLPISGNGYTVMACAGHLLELIDPEKLNPDWGSPWTLDVLPIEVKNWEKEPTKDKKELVENIRAALKEADSVIHAGDPDDEGQLIVDEVLDYLGYTGKVERVYVNDNIEKNIRKAFEQLKDNSECRGAGNAAYARQMADIAFGVNETRLATKRLGSLFTIGRVQTPTLGLVVRRDEQIENHITQKYYELTAHGTSDAADGEIPFKFKPTEAVLEGEKHLFNKDVLEQLKAALDGTEQPFTTEVKEKRVSPPLPYNLTVLLSDMSRRYKFGAAKTQQITQDLRDKYKAITYNRTDCQYLKEEHYADAAAVLGVAMQNLGVNWQLDYSIKSKAFNEKNVTAHHGIIPQEAEIDVSKMTADELKVYAAIVERYAMQFLPPAVYDVSTSVFETEQGRFECVMKKLKEAGWKATFGNAVEPDEEESAKGWIEAGNHIAAITHCSIDEKETTPPKPYTEGTLISDMASIAKYVTDPEIKAVLQKKDEDKKGEHGGIGTTATRSEIIEKLKQRGFVEDQKGKLRSTEKGRAFYHLLPEDIKGADVTAKWWLLQQDIANGKAGVNAIQESVIEVFRSHQDTAYVGAAIPGKTRMVVGKCPLCGKDVVQSGKIYTCTSNKNEKQEDGTWKQVEGCGFKLFGFANKKFTPKQAESLLAGKQVTLRGCKSKSGKSFDCKVKLAKDGKIEPTFENKGKR